MALLDAVFVLGMIGLVVYGTIRLLTRPQEDRPAVQAAGQWRTAHYDVDGTTHVVVQKVSAAGHLLDEHEVATIRINDEDYDSTFLAAMARARERRALFEAEEG